MFDYGMAYDIGKKNILKKLAKAKDQMKVEPPKETPKHWMP
jgi:hypothetical protein